MRRIDIKGIPPEITREAENRRAKIKKIEQDEKKNLKEVVGGGHYAFPTRSQIQDAIKVTSGWMEKNGYEPPRPLRDVFQDLIKENSDFFFITESKKVIGLCVTRKIPLEGEEKDKLPLRVLTKVGLESKYRGCGIGKQLLELPENFERQPHVIALETITGKLDKAIEAYKKLGFKTLATKEDEDKKYILEEHISPLIPTLTILQTLQDPNDNLIMYNLKGNRGLTALRKKLS